MMQNDCFEMRVASFRQGILHKKFLGLLSLLAFALFMVPGVALAKGSIRVIGGPNGSGELIITRGMMEQHSIILKTIDTNFREEGIQAFRGIPLKKVMALAGGHEVEGIAMIARNDYVTYEPAGHLSEKVILAFEVDGKKIKRKRGGPYKIMYPVEMNASHDLYNWYVNTIMLENSVSRSLTLSAGEKTRRLTLSEAGIVEGMQLKTVEQEGYIAPRGDLKSAPSVNRYSRAEGYLLNDLLKFSLGLSKVGSVEMQSFNSHSLILDQKVLRYPIMVVTRLNGKALTYRQGGAVAVLFPLQEYPELLELLPDKGVFHFLERISVYN